MSQPGWKRIEPGNYLHLETGIKIRRRAAHRDFGYPVGLRWELIIPSREGSRTWGTARTLERAQQRARILFPEARTEIAEVWDMAHYTLPDPTPMTLADRVERANKDRVSALPDPTVTGPCQVQATFMCTGQAAGERLIPTSMLPDAPIPGPLCAPMCQPCYDHLADAYVAALHRRPA